MTTEAAYRACRLTAEWTLTASMNKTYLQCQIEKKIISNFSFSSGLDQLLHTNTFESKVDSAGMKGDIYVLDENNLEFTCLESFDVVATFLHPFSQSREGLVRGSWKRLKQVGLDGQLRGP